MTLKNITLYLLAVLSIIAGSANANNDWPSYGRDLSNQRYSPIKQINKKNVANLSPAWTYNSGVKATFQSTPIIVGEVMYLSLPFNHVVALNAKTGEQLWRYNHQRKKDYPMCCGPANRGVAVSDGKVYIGTVDARLIALDAKNGKVVWDIEVADSKSSTGESVETLKDGDPLKKGSIAGQSGVGIAMAPVVYQGKVLIGITGVGYGLHLDSDREGAPLGAVIGIAGNYGRNGFLAAFDAKTGQRVWQFDTIAPHNWEGQFRETTPDGVPLNRDIAKEKTTLDKYPNASKFGGGSAWTTPAIDKERGLLYFGTGNPSPQMDDVSRPGDNLYSVSLVCLDIHTGKIRWHYQQVPHDQWGYDVASPPVLFNYKHKNKIIPAVGHPSKIGWYYIHDRITGELVKKSDNFVEQKNLFARATSEGVTILPGVLGGVNWSPSSVNEQKQTAYVAAIHWPVKYSTQDIPATKDKPAIHYTTLEPLMDAPRWGLLSAINLTTGKMKWQHKTSAPLVGGVLATDGGLIFMGEAIGTDSGQLNAFDADTGKVLWQHKTEAGVNAPPVTYQIDGTQYIAVAVGGNQIFGFKQGDSLRVFALPKK